MLSFFSFFSFLGRERARSTMSACARAHAQNVNKQEEVLAEESAESEHAFAWNFEEYQGKLEF